MHYETATNSKFPLHARLSISINGKLLSLIPLTYILKILYKLARISFDKNIKM